MDKIKFDLSEMEIQGEIPGMRPGDPGTPIYKYPISRRENFMRFVKNEDPLWIPHIKEIAMINPACVPDNWARGMVTIKGRPDESKMGGPDMFGVEWEYMPDEHASMVRPGKYPVKEIDSWEEYVTLPDVDSWDWEGAAALVQDIINDGRVIQCTCMNGLFERLISFVGMEEALVDMIDEDYEEDVRRLFDYLCGLYDKIFLKMKTYFHADIVWFHDDWGSQRAPFFSVDTVRSMLLPYLKRVTESAHKYGILMNFHSCGKIEDLVPVMIEAGVDMWDGQPLNDKEKILREYKNQLICNDAPRTLNPASEPETVKDEVEDFLKKYQGLKVYVGMHHGMNAREYPEFYQQSRMMYTA